MQSSVAVSSCQSRLSVIPAGERIFAQISVFICLPCLFWYPADNLHRTSDTGKCWGVSALRWDEGWLYYHFKWWACQARWFCSSLTCHTSLSGSHRSPVLLRVLLSLLFCLTAVVTSSSSSRFPVFLPSLHPTLTALVSTCVQKHIDCCNTLHDWPCLGWGRLFAVFSLLKESLELFEDTPRLGRRRNRLFLWQCLWGERDGL